MRQVPVFVRTLVTRRAPSSDRIQRRSWLVPSLRASLFALITVVTLLDGMQIDSALWLTALGATAVAAQWRDRNDVLTQLLIFAEATIAAVGGVLASGSNFPMLAYLPATALAAGIAAGVHAALRTSALIAVLLVAGRGLVDGAMVNEYATNAAQLALFSLTTGILGGLLRGILRDGSTAGAERFVEAYRLLEQLRGVTRRLPGSLDPGTVATTLISDCRAVADFSRAGVFLQTGGSVLVPLAIAGVRRVPWRVDLDEPGPVASAWHTRSPVVENRSADIDGRRRGSRLIVLPITVSSRPVGVVVLEAVDGQLLDERAVADLRPIVEASGLPLETAVLFDDLRSSAALEERERLAKEMHDGIAQDLAYLGVELDSLLGELRKDGLERPVAHVQELRQRITGLITDLRLSMSDLRSSTGPTRGLGAALSEYTRSVGTSSAIT
ncbi:MAG: histidine kinase, partial [Mycobacteriales bacterium]